jgi:peptidoglycan/LPS O-acetylase OafA/YrhL
MIDCRGTSASQHLDLIRGMAAVAVMLGHLRALLFVEYGAVRSQNLGVNLLYAVTGLGHQSVMVFFVLSGFFIGGSVIQARRSGRWGWSDYLIARGVRLEIVLIPALIACLLFDQAGMSLSAGRDLYLHPQLNIWQRPIPESSTIAAFLGNVFFLQTIAVPSFGSNGALWSLANEFWYYLLFPLMVAIVWRGKAVHTRVLAFVLAGGIAIFVGKGILLGFLIWLMGVAVSAGSRAHLPPLLQTTLRIAATLAFAVVLALSRRGQAGDFLVGSAFAVLLFSIIQNTKKSHTAIYARLTSCAAGFSYTLYAVHLPFLLLMRAIILPKVQWQPEGGHLAGYLGLALVTIAYAYAVSRFTEAKTDAVRRKVRETVRSVKAKWADYEVALR